MKYLIIVFVLFSIKITAQIGAVWNSPTSGTLDGVSFTISGVTAGSINTINLTGTAYSTGPLSTVQEYLAYGENSEWSITFASPIPNLRLYLIFWRPGQDYIFSGSSTPTILSARLFSLNGNALTVQSSSLGEGIIEFPGNTTTLSLSHVFSDTSFMGLTFGLANALDIDELGLEESIKLYPNPTSDNVSISLSKPFSSLNIEVIDIHGKLIMKDSYPNQRLINMELKEASGIYFVKVITQELSITKKVVKL